MEDRFKETSIRLKCRNGEMGDEARAEGVKTGISAIESRKIETATGCE